MAGAIMFQGTGSDVGKSLIVAGLCRLFADQGLRVAPFKPQNMSNNAAATPGGEIGRAQALQARAARVAAGTDMNPVLLKPEAGGGAQVILQGRRLATVPARDYGAMKAQLLPRVLESFGRLRQDFDLILAEGAGSPAEINLREGDIANMGFAEAADLPVLLIGDIDRGGVIAQIAGTSMVLPMEDRDRIKGFVINKFRGDPDLFTEGLRQAESFSGWPGLGLVPWFDGAARLPAEDSLGLRQGRQAGPLMIAVPVLPGIANFDDLDPLRTEPAVTLRLIRPGEALPGGADLVLLPGTKSTIAALAAFRAAGWDIDLAAHLRRGGQVLGLCGGYQMLGRNIADPMGIEGPADSAPGLGLLDVTTIMEPEKTVTAWEGQTRDGVPVRGYEIHIGRTEGPDCANAWLQAGGQAEGAASADGRVRGTYVHGLFAGDAFRASFLGTFGQVSALAWDHGIEAVLDDLARHLARFIDTGRILALAGL